MSNTQLIAFSEIYDQIDKTKTIKDRLLDAMTRIQDHWLVTDENEKFLTAIAVACKDATEEEKEIIKEELDFFKSLNAASGGVPIDFETLLRSQVYGGEKWFNVQKIWKQAKENEN